MSSFKPVSMQEVDIFLLEKDLDKIGSILFDLKLMEFFNLEKKGFSKYTSMDNSELSAHLLSLRSTISYLKQFKTNDSGKVIKNSFEKVTRLRKEEKEVHEKITHLHDDQKRQKILASLKINPKDIEQKKVIIGFIAKDDESNIESLKKKKLIKHTFTFEDRIYFSCSSPKEITFSYKEFYLPKKITVDIPLKIKTLEEKKEKIFTELKEIANGNLLNLQREELKLSKETALLESKIKFNKTDNFTVISGYVPSEKIKLLERSLEEELGDSFEMKKKIAKGGDVPTKLDNPGFSGNYEELLKMYSLPKYGEFDPTFLMFLIFPIFYGLILGDVGYGLLSLILFTLLKPKFPQFKGFISILQVSAIFSTLFGVFYGEYFGYEPHIFPFEYHRSEDPVPLLYAAIGFGLVHLNLGLLIGFFQEWKHSKYHAIMDKLVWIILQIGVFSWIGGALIASSALTILGMVFFALAVIMLVKEHGFMGIIEIPSFFTNLLSYARLMAVGVSSVVIAILINEFSIPMIQNGIISGFFGILLLLVGHIFNMVLGNFESFLHSLRLHYVEFFTKFYTGNGREFEPFGKRVHKKDD